MRSIAVAVLVTVGVAWLVHRPQRRIVGDGRGPACALPRRACTERCDELVEMPAAGDGYLEHRLSRERTPATSTSYMRRDLAAVIRYAAAFVACKAADWDTGVGGAIVLGDMSERDGATPGTQWGHARHPAATHERGRDIDVAYFQRDTDDNDVRPICRHKTLAGEDTHHCLVPPERLDAWRTALFIGAILEEPHIRAIGVDGRAARPILRALRELCATGWLAPEACARRDRFAYETSDTGRSWFLSHHTHLHVSIGAVR